MYSVIIPSLGRIEYLNELIDSILNQDLMPNEVLILLDENQHCYDISDQIISNHLIKVIFCNKLNLAQKRNYGAEVAQSKLLIFSDDDDVWSARRGSEVVNVLRTDDICCHNYSKFGAVDLKDQNILGKSDLRVKMSMLFYGANVFGGGSAIACHRDIVRVFQFSSKYKYCEDYEWWLRVILAGVSIKYLGESLVSYRVHGSNMTSVKRDIFYFTMKIAIESFRRGLSEILIALLIAVKSTFVLLKNYFRL